MKHYPHCKYPGVIQEINAAYALLNYCLYAEANQCLKLANEMSQEERGLKLKFEFKFVQAIPTRASDWPKISEQNFVGPLEFLLRNGNKQRPARASCHKQLLSAIRA